MWNKLISKLRARNRCFVGVAFSMANNNKNANRILILVTLGFLASYPASFNFWGKLASSSFSAAMIGGLADWFGVTALFRKPLGIPFRTQIIVKNRKRLTDSLVHMVENELLTKEALIKKIESCNVSKLLASYIFEHEGKKDLGKIIAKLIKDIMSDANLAEFAIHMKELLAESIASANVLPLLIETCHWSRNKGYLEKILTYIFAQCESLLKSPRANSIFASIIDDMLAKLALLSKNEGMITRLQVKTILAVIKVLKITPEKASDKFIEYLLEIVRELQNPYSTRRKELDMHIAQFMEDLKENHDRQDKLDRIIKGYICDLDIISYIEQYYKSLRARILEDEEEYQKLVFTIENLIEKEVLSFKENTSQQVYVNERMKKAIIQIVNEKHSEIGKAIKEKLSTISDENLIDMLEEKAGNDLQIIRINGSMVGGIVGIISFLVTYLLFGG